MTVGEAQAALAEAAPEGIADVIVFLGCRAGAVSDWAVVESSGARRSDRGFCGPWERTPEGLAAVPEILKAAVS
jgi:hypothetical protein